MKCHRCKIGEILYARAVLEFFDTTIEFFDGFPYVEELDFVDNEHVDGSFYFCNYCKIRWGTDSELIKSIKKRKEVRADVEIP